MSPLSDAENESSEIGTLDDDELLSCMQSLQSSNSSQRNDRKRKRDEDENENENDEEFDDEFDIDAFQRDIQDLSNFVVSESDNGHYKEYERLVEKEKKKEYECIVESTQSISTEIEPSPKKRKIDLNATFDQNDNTNNQNIEQCGQRKREKEKGLDINRNTESISKWKQLLNGNANNSKI